MSTYTQILYQVVFGSKDHIPFLTTENENILFGYIAGILKNKSCHSYIVGGAINHFHIITHLHPTIALASMVKDIKMASHKMILKNGRLFLNFPGWQVGYSRWDCGYWILTPPASLYHAKLLQIIVYQR